MLSLQQVLNLTEPERKCHFTFLFFFSGYFLCSPDMLHSARVHTWACTAVVEGDSVIHCRPKFALLNSLQERIFSCQLNGDVHDSNLDAKSFVVN